MNGTEPITGNAPKKNSPPRKQTGMMSAKTKQAINLINNHAVDVKTAIILATDNPKPSRSTIDAVKRKAAKYALTAPSMVKMAHNAVKDAIQGKGVQISRQTLDKEGNLVDVTETVAVPTATNRLAAAAMVFDRVEPIVRQNLNMNVNADVSPVDLDKYRNW